MLVIHSPEPALLQYPRLLSLIVGALVEVKIHQPFLFSYAMLSFLLIAIFLCLTAREWSVAHNSSPSSDNTKTSSPSFGTVWGWPDTWMQAWVRLGWWTCQGHGQYYYRGSTKQYRTTTHQIQDNFQRHAARVEAEQMSDSKCYPCLVIFRV